MGLICIKNILYVFLLIGSLFLSVSCADGSEPIKNSSTLANNTTVETIETDITIAPNSKYYLDDDTNMLIYFAKDTRSTEDEPRFNLVLWENNQEKKRLLTLPSIPDTFIIDNGWVYFTSYFKSIDPSQDPNYEEKLSELTEISPFFGNLSFGNLFRANLETGEIQWLNSSTTYLMDDTYIYFLEAPVDLDQYGDGRPKGCVVSNNSLCRMEKDGSNPILIQTEIPGLEYVSDKYIYTRDFSVNYRVDKYTLEVEETQIPVDYSIVGKVYAKNKMFYTKYEYKDQTESSTVYSYDLTTEITKKIAEYFVPPPDIVPLDDGGLIILQSDSRNRETRQVALIHFFDKDYNLVNTVEAKGRHHITAKDNKVFYILKEMNVEKSIYGYLPGDTYITYTLCSDDQSMQGKNVERIDVIDDSFSY